MPKGTRRTSYVRDGRGRFASTPGGGAPKRPPAKKASRGTNRLTRDNSGRITGVGKDGATARGGRLRTGAGNLRATQTDRLKAAPKGVVSRGGKVRAVPAPRLPSRIANRSAADQAHRDKVAKQWKTVEKPARRAHATAMASVGVAVTVPAYPRLTRASKIRGHSRFVRENVYDQVALLMRSPTRGKNKLTPQQRGQIVADAVTSARSLRARAAMTAPRRSTRNVRAARPGGTIAKPRGMKPGALAAKRQKPAGRVDTKQAISRAKELRQQAKKLQAQGEALMGGGRRDGAIVNMPLSSRSRRSAVDQGIRGSQLVARAATLNNRADRVLERAVASRKKAEREAAKPKRAPRSAESLRLSRAKQVEKRRSITTNPAGNRADAAGRMAANAARTQERALAFYGGKPKKKAVASRSPATSRLRPGELMSAVARPVGTMARPRKGQNPYQAGTANMRYQVSATNDDKKARLANAQATKAMFESQGLSVKYNSGRGSSTVASYNPATKQMTINRSHTSWVNPAASAIQERRRGAKSSSAPMHTFYHEMGHAKDKNLLSRSTPFGQYWALATQKGASQEARVARGSEMSRLARRVSRYATTSPSEFIAETYAGLRTGRRYDFQVMRAYREAMGLSPNPAARRRSRRTARP